MPTQLKKASINSLLLTYSIPAIISMGVASLYSAIDRMFIGHIRSVGDLSIAGIGVTLPIIFILLAFELLIGVGGAANISIKLGQGKQEEAEQFLTQAIVLGLLLSVFLALIFFIFKEIILTWFGGTETTLPFAISYLRIILLGTPFYLVGFSLLTMMRSIGKPKKASIILMQSCLLNIILDPIFIFGLNLGIEGAAIATVLSQVFVGIFTLHDYKKKDSLLKIKKKYIKLDVAYIKPIISFGSSIFIMQLLASLVQVIFNHQLNIYAPLYGIGSMTTIVTILSLFLMPVIGINQGSLPIISYNFGARHYSRVKQAFINGTLAATIILSIGFLLSWLCPRQLISFFNSNSELIQTTQQGLKLYVLALPLTAIALTGPNYFQSIGKMHLAIFLTLLRQLIFLLPLLFILPKYIGINGIWLAQPIADFFACILTLCFLNKEFKLYPKANLSS